MSESLFEGARMNLRESTFEIDGEIHDLDSFKHETAYDSAQMIEEAIECNPPKGSEV